MSVQTNNDIVIHRIAINFAYYRIFIKGSLAAIVLLSLDAIYKMGDGNETSLLYVAPYIFLLIFCASSIAYLGAYYRPYIAFKEIKGFIGKQYAVIDEYYNLQLYAYNRLITLAAMQDYIHHEMSNRILADPRQEMLEYVQQALMELHITIRTPPPKGLRRKGIILANVKASIQKGERYQKNIEGTLTLIIPDTLVTKIKEYLLHSLEQCQKVYSSYANQFQEEIKCSYQRLDEIERFLLRT
jgi:hypothetical protein